MFGISAAAKAEKLHEEGCALSDAGETDRALDKYRAALALDPQRASTHYNIGLIHKYRNQWPESFRHNARADSIRPDNEATCWNLAIAATALRDWATARSVWDRLGMKIEQGDGPIEDDFGSTPVRINPDGEYPEVVWGRRIDPVRVRILSIPFLDSGYRYGDVVLHDGAAVGYRESDGREYPVFNVLELFERSSWVTAGAELFAEELADMDALQSVCDELRVALEDWTSSVTNLCRACSEGRPHDHHHHEAGEGWKTNRHVGLAAATEALLREALARWQGSARKVLDLVHLPTV